MVHVKFSRPGETPTSEIINVDFGKLYGAWSATPRGQHLSTDTHYVTKKTEGARSTFEEQLRNGQVEINSVAASFVDNNVTLHEAPMGQIFNLMSAVKAGKIAPADIGSVMVRVPKDQVPQFAKNFAPHPGG